MLATVEVLKEYRNFLLGANITIITHHKYLLAESSHNHQVFKWKQRKEKYNPNFKSEYNHTSTQRELTLQDSNSNAASAAIYYMARCLCKC